MQAIYEPSDWAMQFKFGLKAASNQQYIIHKKYSQPPLEFAHPLKIGPYKKKPSFSLHSK